jgi:hypothetical protein
VPVISGRVNVPNANNVNVNASTLRVTTTTSGRKQQTMNNHSNIPGFWVVIVDGNCYGFFQTNAAAIAFVSADFPVAFGQDNYTIYEFIHV